jgi:hypothetical protein
MPSEMDLFKHPVEIPKARINTSKGLSSTLHRNWPSIPHERNQFGFKSKAMKSVESHNSQFLQLSYKRIPEKIIVTETDI